MKTGGSGNQTSLNDSLFVRLGLSLVGGILSAGAFPPYGLPVLLPFGIAAFLRGLHGATPRQAAYLGFAFGMVFFGATLFWLSSLFSAASVSLIAIAACFPMLFSVLRVLLHRRFPTLPLWLLAPLLWTGIEYYRSEPFVLNFGWMGLGYSVVNSPIFARLASLIGGYGVTSALVLLATLLADRWMKGRQARLEMVALMGLWLLLLSLPLPRSVPSRPLHVALVQAMMDEDSLFSQSQPGLVLPVDVIVWPEYSFNSDPTRDPKTWKRLQEVARSNQAWFVFGAKDQPNPDDENAYRNTAYLLDPKGEPAGRHVKNHTVHFVRDGIPGKDARALPTSLGRLGIAICFDMDYPDVARRLAQDNAEVFLVPNMDPLEWGEVQRSQHRLSFQMRAAECGRWLARADVAGGTSVAAPDGREVRHVGTANPARLDVLVGRTTEQTGYTQGGWVFGPACFWLSAGLCVWGAIGPRRRRPDDLPVEVSRGDDKDSSLTATN